MRRVFRRLLAHIYYLKRPTLGFLPLLLGTTLLILVGGFCFQHLYTKDTLSFGAATYRTYCMIFMEHHGEYPRHIVLQTFYWILPLIGLVVVLDGIMRFSYHVLRRDENGKEWIQAVTRTYSNHVVLVGLGKVGVRVLQQLLKLGEDVVVLEKNPDNDNFAFAKRQDVPVLVGSVRQEGITEQLNVAAAKSIILATDDDLANLELAMDARQINPDIRVVLRMFDQDLASKIQDSMDIHQAYSTSAIAAPVFATSSVDRSIVNAFYVKERLLVVAELEIRAHSEITGRTVGDLRRENHIFVVSHERHGHVDFYPGGETEIQPGDRVTLQTEPDILRQVHDWNGGPVT